jgi:hypothetical protein
MEYFIFLLIEFVDELVFGAADAAWPLIQNDLALNYVQIGLALSLPGFLANFIAPFIAILGECGSLWASFCHMAFAGRADCAFHRSAAQE